MFFIHSMGRVKDFSNYINATVDAAWALKKDQTEDSDVVPVLDKSSFTRMTKGSLTSKVRIKITQVLFFLLIMTVFNRFFFLSFPHYL